MTNVVLFGTGNIAGTFDRNSGPNEIKTHAKALSVSGTFHKALVVDVVREKAESFAKTWGFDKGIAMADFVASRCSASLCVVASSTDAHVECLTKALAVPGVRMVLAEKPLTGDSNESRRLLQEFKGRKVHVVENYFRSFHPGTLALLGSIKSMGIGQLTQISCTITRGFMNSATHALNVLQKVWGDIKFLSYCKSNWFFNVGDDTPLRISEVPFQKKLRLFELDFMGTEGRIVIEGSGDRVCIYRNAPSANFPGFYEWNVESNFELEYHDYMKYVYGYLESEMNNGHVHRDEDRLNQEKFLDLLDSVTNKS